APGETRHLRSVPQETLLARETVILARDRGHLLDLRDPAPQRLLLQRPLSLTPGELVALALERPDQRAETRRALRQLEPGAVSVPRVPLSLRAQPRPVLMVAVQIRQRVPQRLERGRRDDRAVDERPSAPVGEDLAADHQLVVAVLDAGENPDRRGVVP